MLLDITTAIAAKALDGLYARQAATANNVANASSNDFVPMRVSFEAELQQAAQFRTGDSNASMLKRIAQVTPQLTMPDPEESATVRLDKELTTASETSARYAMLIGMLTREIQMKNLAVNGN